jgi:hypothetical protein
MLCIWWCVFQLSMSFTSIELRSSMFRVSTAFVRLEFIRTEYRDSFKKHSNYLHAHTHREITDCSTIFYNIHNVTSSEFLACVPSNDGETKQEILLMHQRWINFFRSHFFSRLLFVKGILWICIYIVGIRNCNTNYSDF